MKTFIIKYGRPYHLKLVEASNMADTIYQFQRQVMPMQNIAYLEIEEVDILPNEQKVFQLGHSIELELADIPAGTFHMGSSRFKNEQPIYEVSMPAFAIGKYPVTQAQWKAIMGTEPSYFKGDNHPVEQVSWHEAQEFCRRLSEMTGQHFRLPTEAEWEYACRAGSTGDYCFGDDTSKLGDYAWYDDNSNNTTHPVGLKKPNAFGLYDMHGNVWEWCQDSWHPNYEGAPTDGSAWEGDSPYKVLRGGSWFSNRVGARAVCRNYDHAADRLNDTGFRVVAARPSSL